MQVIDSEVIASAVQMACRAPSLHNSQPWAWVAEAETLHLFADRDRVGQATDSSGREVILSCGAVLDHLRVAMAAAGFDTHTKRLPDPGDPDHLASLDFMALRSVNDAHRRRAEAIRRAAPIGVRLLHPKVGSRLNPCCVARSMLRPRCLTWWPNKLVRDWRVRRG